MENINAKHQQVVIYHCHLEHVSTLMLAFSSMQCIKTWCSTGWMNQSLSSTILLASYSTLLAIQFPHTHREAVLCSPPIVDGSLLVIVMINNTLKVSLTPISNHIYMFYCNSCAVIFTPELDGRFLHRHYAILLLQTSLFLYFCHSLMLLNQIYFTPMYTSMHTCCARPYINTHVQAMTDQAHILHIQCPNLPLCHFHTHSVCHSVIPLQHT